MARAIKSFKKPWKEQLVDQNCLAKKVSEFHATLFVAIRKKYTHLKKFFAVTYMFVFFLMECKVFIKSIF